MRIDQTIILCTALFILTSCDNKNQQNKSKPIQKSMMKIENLQEIKQHIELQKRVNTEEEGFENPYSMTERDLELASAIILRGLINNGYKKISDEDFNQRILYVFGIKNMKTTNYKVHVTDNYISVFGNQNDDYQKLKRSEFYSAIDTRNYFLLINEHIIMELEYLDDLIKINNDNTFKIIIKPSWVHRNKYIFNNDKASLAWLINNESFFLSSLLTTYGFDKEGQINKLVLDSVYKENPKYPEFISQLFFIKDSYNKLIIREGLLKFVEENTSAKDNRFIYALGYFMSSLYTEDRNHIFEEDPSKKFTPLEKAEIVANIANIENPAIEKYKSVESSLVWNKAGSSLYNLSVSHPEVIKLIEANNYFGLPKMKEIIAKLQDEAPPTGADPE